MQKKASEGVRLTINLGPTVFSQLNEEARVLHTPTSTLAASYVEEHIGRKQVASFFRW
jgi:quinolinate synthase